MGAKRESVSSPRTYAVLCVDDHVPGLNIRKVFLESFGYSVQTARSGPEALDLLAKAHFDVAVMDYRMPGMDGLDLARTLKEQFPSLPLIALSGYSSELPAEFHRLMGGCVDKGSHPAALLRLLAEVLGSPAPRHQAESDATVEQTSQPQTSLPKAKRRVRRASDADPQAGKRMPGTPRRSA